MKYLRVRNWDRWQSYRSDRGQPPWIKLHRGLLRNYEWLVLTDCQKGQLVSLWMLAADRDGEIPADPKVLKKLCGLESEPDLQVFIEQGFIEGDAIVTPTWRRGDANVTPQSRGRVETETEEEEEKNKTAEIAFAISPPAGGVLSRARKSTLDYSPAFDAAWSAYGKDRGNKAKAATEYAKAVREIRKRKDAPEDADAWLLGRVEAYQKSKADTERKFIPHMERWLSDGGFDTDHRSNGHERRSTKRGQGEYAEPDLRL